MGRAASIAYVSFPPLSSVIGLESAPAAVSALLGGRWMAEPVAAGAEGAFTIRWRRGTGAAAPGDELPQPVEWQPEVELGALANACGRVLLAPEGQESRVELATGALERPACFEPLVEAALGDALAAGGECFLHAAAVELGGRRPLLIGDSGSGKSTLSVAVAACGGRVISDDSLLLGRVDGRPLVRAARRNVWLRPGSAALVPALRRRGLTLQPADDGRLRLDRERCAEAFLSSARPDCLVLLRRNLGESGLASRRLTQAEGLAALLQGGSALYLTDARFAPRQRRLLDLMTLFAERLPAIELRVGSSLLDSTEECLAAIVDALP